MSSTLRSDLEPRVSAPPSVASPRPTRRLRLPRAVVLPAAVVAVALVAWEVLPAWLNTPDYIFPRLSLVLDKMTSEVTLDRILTNAQATILHAMTGLVIGVASGIVVGFVLGEFQSVRMALYPSLIAFQSIPKVAIAPLFIIWFGFDATPKIVIVSVLCFFPVLVNTMNGLMTVDRARVDLFRALCASRFSIWLRLLLPSTLPSILSGVELATVYAMIGAITAEFVGAQSGLGVLLMQFRINYDSAGVFVVLILLAVVGALLNGIVRYLRRRLVFWP